MTGTFQNVTVPEGQFCFLSNSVVTGNAKSLEDATFFSVNNIIRGNLEADKSRRVLFTGNTTAGGPADKQVVGNTVRENLQCKENDPPFVGQPNVVGGNAEDQCEQPSSQQP